MRIDFQIFFNGGLHGNYCTFFAPIVFGISFETSGFIADDLEHGWERNQDPYRHVRQLVINLDNGSNNSSFLTQFIKRLTEFSDNYDLDIALAYYPQYHSKYNPIERCWGILENHWNGAP